MKEKIFYSVVSRFYDNGKEEVFRGADVVAEDKPRMIYRELESYDEYIDYFEAEEGANEFMELVLHSC